MCVLSSGQRASFWLVDSKTMLSMCMCTCGPAHRSRPGRRGELIGVEPPAGVQAVWLELLTLYPRFSLWQITGAKARPETEHIDTLLSCAFMKNPLLHCGKQSRSQNHESFVWPGSLVTSVLGREHHFCVELLLSYYLYLFFSEMDSWSF